MRIITSNINMVWLATITERNLMLPLLGNRNNWGAHFKIKVMEVVWNVNWLCDSYENNIHVSRFKMALIMSVANILRVSLETKHCINFLHSRNISCLHRNFNKYLLREARVMHKVLGNKRTGKCVPCFYLVHWLNFVFNSSLISYFNRCVCLKEFPQLK